jgi:hypothetical protein
MLSGPVQYNPKKFKKGRGGSNARWNKSKNLGPFGLLKPDSITFAQFIVEFVRFSFCFRFGKAPRRFTLHKRDGLGFLVGHHYDAPMRGSVISLLLNELGHLSIAVIHFLQIYSDYSICQLLFLNSLFWQRGRPSATAGGSTYTTTADPIYPASVRQNRKRHPFIFSRTDRNTSTSSSATLRSFSIVQNSRPMLPQNAYSFIRSQCRRHKNPPLPDKMTYFFVNSGHAGEILFRRRLCGEGISA